MKLKLFLSCFAAVLVFPAVALSQAGVYGQFSVDRLSGLAGSPAAGTNTARSNVNPLGGTVGAYYAFRDLGPFRLGADLRGTFLTDQSSAYQGSQGAGSRMDSVLGGVRGSFHTPIKVLHPYLQASAGLSRSDYGLIRDSVGRAKLVNGLQVEGFAGLDLDLLPNVDFRVFELGYGVSNPLGNGSHNYPVESVSVGIVFHLTRE